MQCPKTLEAISKDILVPKNETFVQEKCITFRSVPHLQKLIVILRYNQYNFLYLYATKSSFPCFLTTNPTMMKN